MDEVGQFKKENGDVNYSTKELVGALHVKLDDFENKMDEKIQKVENKIEIMKDKKVNWNHFIYIISGLSAFFLILIFGGPK
jgi:biopolymer transport protein ExbD